MFLPLVAFGIAHLPMLGWLAAAAVPLAIHLLSRRRYRETPWAAMEYLLAALKRRARKIRLEQWLLLALRTLLVVLVVLAVAEPYTQRPGLAFVPGVPTHRVLVLDGSYSMACKAADKSRFELAKELAERIVDQSPQGDAFTLVLMAAPPRVVVGTPTSDAGPLREEIENLDILHTAADLPATVEAVRQLLDKDKTQPENARLQRHVVYFLTDLQRTTWSPEMSEAALAEFRRQTGELAQAAALEVIDLGQPPAENLAVTALTASERVVTVGRSVELEVRLRDFGRRARPEQPVELWIDGRRAARQSVAVPGGGEASARFSCRFETPGDHALEVRAEGDALDVDNHRYLVIPVRQAVRVLCVDGRPSGDPLGGTTRFLATALAPEAGRSDHAPIEVEVRSESALLERDLAAYDCVLLSNVARFTASEAQAMDAYLARGGSLVFFLGDQVLPDEYNRQLGGAGGGRRLLPARLDSLVSQPQPGLDPLGYRHPIVEAFRGRPKSGLLTTIVSKYIKLQPIKGSAAKVALALANGDPLVVEEPIRRGRVVLVATSADVSWTPMPVWFSYVPLVQEIVAWCVGSQSGQRNVEVGEPLEDPVGAAAGDVPVAVERPDGQVRSAGLRAEAGDGVWTYGDTYRSGVYTARFGPPLGRSRSFAVNVDPSEGDLAPVGIEELQSEVWPGIPFECQTSPHALDARVAGPAPSRGRLHVALLYAVLALLFLETFLAWQFGHHQPSLPLTAERSGAEGPLGQSPGVRAHGVTNKSFG
jgi:hypothetical protein